MLSEPASSLTDLALGLVTLGLALDVRERDVNRYWSRMLWWATTAALAGAVHHAFVTFSDKWSEPSWAVISGLVVITISYTLAATVEDVLGPGHQRVFWLLRTAGLGAYGGLAVFGYFGVSTMLACEGVTMVTILVLWGIALYRGHSRAPTMLLALAASAAAGGVRALPSGVTKVVGLDPTSLYHLAQIPGMVLVLVALSTTSFAGASVERGPPNAVGAG
jgi:small-conductance mechanosensitive channel